jgi:cytochrome c5
MADPHHSHHDPIEDNIETHPMKLAIGVVIGAFALIVGLILLVQFAVGLYAGRSLKDDPAMSAEAVAARIKPVAQLAVDPNAPPPAPAAPATAAPAVASVTIPPAATKTAAAGGIDGKGVYDKVCTACHTAGVAGAPKLGDKAAWAPRLKQGKEQLYVDALKGKGAMPPKGGNPALSDAEVKAAVDYMVSTVK